MFLPGQELMTAGRSRATAVLDRVLALSDEQVDHALEAATSAFRDRHRHLSRTFADHFAMIAHRLDDPRALTPNRKLLAGAYFSQEYAVEAAALFNPSMVAHPDQAGLAGGTTRFVMSVRAVGEGHVSSVGFRTGTVDADARVTFDVPGHPLAGARSTPGRFAKAQFIHQLGHRDEDRNEAAAFVLDELPETFDRADLDRAMATLDAQSLTRGPASRVVERLEWIAASHYSLTFNADSTIDERVILPTGPAESHGLEDVRLVRFTHRDGTAEYLGTYTAFDGHQVVPALLRTSDFRTFHVEQASGPAARNKGMAIFPRAVGGRYLALSRWDRESNHLAESVDLSHWEILSTLQEPALPWQIVQVGNCGSPLETPQGWLVLTHGVGPVREYAIGAMLLDLADPSVVVGQLDEPLLRPTADEREGYVPNVVYSCGAMLHGGTVVLPYGCSDSSIRVALIDLAGLLDRLRP